jgi:hypothetical protein
MSPEPTTAPVPTTSTPLPSTGRKPVRWAYWPFRILISLVTVIFALQAIFAGQIMSGTFGSLLVHQNNAALADMVLIVSIPAAILLRWPGRGPFWPLLAVLALIAVSYTQSYFGFQRLMTVHVPLGLTIIIVSLELARWAWRVPREKRETDVA